MNNSTDDGPTSNSTNAALLDMINHQFTMVILPVTIGLGILNAVGIIGNILVIIVYTKFYDRSNFRYFVLFLAYTDITSCMTCIPGEVFTQLNWFKLTYKWLCKSKVYFNVTTSWNSASLLLLFSFDRFRKISFPLQWQIRPFQARALCAGVSLVSAMINFLNPYGWTVRTYELPTPYGPVNVSVCGKSDELSETVHEVLTYVFTLGMLVIMLLTTLLNIMTARKVLCGKRLPSSASVRTRPRSSIRTSSIDVICVTQHLSNINESGPGTNEDTSNVDTLESPDETGGTTKTPKWHLNEAYEYNLDGRDDQPSSSRQAHHTDKVFKRSHSSIGTVSLSTGVLHNASRKVRKANGRRTQKLVIMFVLTMVFIVTMTIYMITVLYFIPKLNNPSLTNSEKVVYFAAWRLYFVNYMMNPFLYGFMDQRFRTALRHLFCKR